MLQFDLSKYKFVEEMDVVAGLDSRMDLLALKPVEFEHLIRQLFEAIGMKSWVTQASRDEGVDGVATNEDPIVGGLCTPVTKPNPPARDPGPMASSNTTQSATARSAPDISRGASGRAPRPR